MNHLKENNGKDSSIRMIFFYGTIWNIAMTTYLLVFKDNDPMSVAAYFSAIEGVLGGLKVIQKTSEEKK